MLERKIVFAAALALASSACSALGSNHTIPAGGSPDVSPAIRSAGATSVLKLLTKQAVIGSTVDPINGDQNPYGLVIAPDSAGKVKANDIYVCNFNDKSNVQGTGTTVIALSPTVGSMPARFAQSSSLLGCAAIAFGYGTDMWAAAFGAKSETQLTDTGKVKKAHKGGNYVRPFGTAFGTNGGPYPTSAVWVSDASTGSIVLAEYCVSGQCEHPGTAIVTGFAVNHGQPGSILGPSGLAFDPYSCGKIGNQKVCGTLFIADGANNTVVEIYNALNLRNAGSIVVGASGKTFTGADGSWAHLLYAGKPLDGPISSTLVYGKKKSAGNLVVGNTLNPNGQNLLIEISPTGSVLDTVNVDTGAAGALFGMQATGVGADTQFFFNDDNANNVQVLEK